MEEACRNQTSEVYFLAFSRDKAAATTSLVQDLDYFCAVKLWKRTKAQLISKASLAKVQSLRLRCRLSRSRRPRRSHGKFFPRPDHSLQKWCRAEPFTMFL